MIKVGLFIAMILQAALCGTAYAQTPDDNPVINAWRQHGEYGTPTDNFMYNAQQRYGSGTPDDNFVTHMMNPRPQPQYQPAMPDGDHSNDGLYQDRRRY